MSTKLRLMITKGEAIRYISHLDYARTIERALRRSKLPVAYSEGFNPHMKMAFASALSVGVTSDAEYMDIDLAEELTLQAFSEALMPQMPEAIQIKKIRTITAQHKSLMAVVNLATYTIIVPSTDDAANQIEDIISAFNNADNIKYIKENPKGRREIDVKEYIAEPVRVTAGEQDIRLEMTIRITPTGSIKPSEVLKVLIDNFALPARGDAALINRTGLYVDNGGRRTSLIDIG